MIETPEGAANRFAKPMLARGFRFIALHAYTDASAGPLFWRIRLKHPDTGEKWIRPMTMNGQGWELNEPRFSNGKALYGLHHIAKASGAIVWVVEGEQKADELHKLGMVATTSGSATSAKAADWEPLRGRTVRIWPDNDDPGKAHASEVATMLHTKECLVSCLDTDQLGLGQGEDVIQWLQKNPWGVASEIEALPVLHSDWLTSGLGLPAVGGRVVLVRGDAEDPEPIDWIWLDWLAAGKLHILAGQAGTGKTSIAIALAANISSGSLFPDGSPAPLGDTLVWSGEDDFRDTILPRFIANGGQRNRIHHIRGCLDENGALQPFDPAHDIGALVDAAKGLHDLKLIIIDPIVSAVPGDSHKNAEVRRAMQPLVQLAKQAKAAILGVTHLTKGTAGREPIERITGSLAFTAMPRLVWVTAKPSEPGQLARLVRVKSNNGPDGGGIEYGLQQVPVDQGKGIIGQKIVWGEVLEGCARDLIAELEAPSGPNYESALERAEAWLKEILGTGTVRVPYIETTAAQMGHAWATVQRAKRALGVVSVRQGSDGWAWYMPKVIKDA